MSDIANIYNLRKADQSYKRHSTSKDHFLRPIKIGPEPFNSRILRGIYYMTTTSVPALTREGKDIPFQGTNLKTAGQLQFGNETTIGFRTAGDYLGRNELEQWMFEMGNPLDGTGSFCVGEDSTIQYILVNDQGRAVRGYEFIGVFPSSLGEINYSSESDNITTFDVTFTYSYWQPLALDGLDIQDDLPDSDSFQTNTSVIYNEYENLISERESSTDAC